MSSPSRVGWRHFKCHECGYLWRETCRDCMSPSGDECPECSARNNPIDAVLDPTIPVDKWGNLIEYKTEPITKPTLES